MHHPTDRITHTTVFVIPVVEHWLQREIDQWVHHEGSFRRPIAPLHRKHQPRVLDVLLNVSCVQNTLFFSFRFMLFSQMFYVKIGKRFLYCLMFDQCRYNLCGAFMNSMKGGFWLIGVIYVDFERSPGHESIGVCQMHVSGPDYN